MKNKQCWGNLLPVIFIFVNKIILIPIPKGMRKKEEFGKKAITAIVMNDRLPCMIEKSIYEKVEDSKSTSDRMH